MTTFTDGVLTYTTNDFREIACMECLTEFNSVLEAEEHAEDNPGHAVIVSDVQEMEIIKA